MPTEIRILCDDPDIEDRWLAFVDSHRLLRRATSGPSFTNPTTGQVISMGCHPNDAEVLIDGEWQYAFQWRSGRIVINERTVRDPKLPVRKIVLQLTSALSAKAVDDDGNVVAG